MPGVTCRAERLPAGRSSRDELERIRPIFDNSAMHNLREDDNKRRNKRDNNKRRLSRQDVEGPVARGEDQGEGPKVKGLFIRIVCVMYVISICVYLTGCSNIPIKEGGLAIDNDTTAGIDDIGVNRVTSKVTRQF